jgi:DNA-binding NtrC family response regulator
MTMAPIVIPNEVRNLHLAGEHEAQERLPARTEQTMQAGNSFTARGSRKHIGKTQMNERILVVDDEEDLRLSLKFKLKSAGFEVDVAADGEEALEKLSAKQADIALLDIDMPRMGGIETLANIRQKYPLTEAIMLTGMQDLKTAVECMDKGAFYYVTKPYYVHDLLGLIERALERKRLIMQNEALKSQLALCVLSANVKSQE